MLPAHLVAGELAGKTPVERLRANGSEVAEGQLPGGWVGRQPLLDDRRALAVRKDEALGVLDEDG